MKRVMITGATGFIGRYLVHELLTNDIEVYGIVRDFHKAKDLLPNHTNLKIIQCDHCNYRSLIKIMEGIQIDCVYHLAWNGVSGENIGIADIQVDNIKGVINIIEVANILKVDTFVGIGSIHELEYIQQITQGEKNDNLNIMYKSAKLCAHSMAQNLAKQYHLKFFWPILTNTFGVNEDSERLLLQLIKKLLNGKSLKLTSCEQCYDFVYVSDVAKALYLIVERGVPYKSYMIKSNSSRKLKTYLTEVRNLINPDVELLFHEAEFDGVMLDKAVFMNDNLKNDTGFEPKVSFQKGIHLMKDWLIKEQDYEI